MTYFIWRKVTRNVDTQLKVYCIGNFYFIYNDDFITNISFLVTVLKCHECNKPILDRFILKVLDIPYHASCLRCVECKQQLNSKCYSKDNYMFCKHDFFK